MSESLNRVHEIEDNLYLPSDIPFPELAIYLARAVRVSPSLSTQEKRSVLNIIRAWSEFVHKRGYRGINYGDPDLLPIIKVLYTDFAASLTGKYNELFNEVDLDKSFSSVRLDSYSFFEDGLQNAGMSKEEASKLIEIAHKKDFALRGGAARLFAMFYFKHKHGVQSEVFTSFLSSEFPLNDIDLFVHGAHNEEVALQYGADSEGIKIIEGGDFKQSFLKEVWASDLTMNQVAVHNGMLYFTEYAKQDLRTGNIRAVGAGDPLFGMDSVRWQDGLAYMLPKGIYRALAMLLRGKGQRIIIAKENLDRERDNMQRYWLVLLKVKIMKIQNADKRNEAILQWHKIAQKFGATESERPAEFLRELHTSIEFKTFSSDEERARWFLSTLSTRVLETVIREDVDLPWICTPMYITRGKIDMSDKVSKRQLKEFSSAIKKLKEEGKW